MDDIDQAKAAFKDMFSSLSAAMTPGWGQMIGHHLGRACGLVIMGVRKPKAGLYMGAGFLEDLLAHTAMGFERATKEYEILEATLKKTDTRAQETHASST